MAGNDEQGSRWGGKWWIALAVFGVLYWMYKLGSEPPSNDLANTSTAAAASTAHRCEELWKDAALSSCMSLHLSAAGSDVAAGEANQFAQQVALAQEQCPGQDYSALGGEAAQTATYTMLERERNGEDALNALIGACSDAIDAGYERLTR